MGGEVAVIAGAVTEIVKAGGQVAGRINARNDRQDAAFDVQQDALRHAVPAPAPLHEPDGHRWLASSPAGAVVYVAEVDNVASLSDADLRDGFRAKLLETFDAAIAKGTRGPIGIAVVIYPAAQKA